MSEKITSLLKLRICFGEPFVRKERNKRFCAIKIPNNLPLRIKTFIAGKIKSPKDQARLLPHKTPSGA